MSARSLLSLLLALGLVGCSCAESHVRDDAGARVDTGGIGDYGCLCCDGATILAGGPEECPALCAGRCEDAGVAPECVQSGEVACFTQAPAVGDPFSITLRPRPSLDGVDCYCGQDLVSELATDAQGVALTSELCPPVALCRACLPPPTSTVSFTPTEAGTTVVRLDGQDAFALDVARAGIGGGPTPTCVVAAPGDFCADVRTVRSFVTDKVCYGPTATPGTQVTIRVEDPCGGCEPIGPCTVRVGEGRIVVEPTYAGDRCDRDCTEVCTNHVHVCVTPPLPEGHYDVVFPGGLDINDDQPSPTLDVGGGDPADEVCYGAGRGR